LPLKPASFLPSVRRNNHGLTAQLAELRIEISFRQDPIGFLRQSCDHRKFEGLIEPLRLFVILKVIGKDRQAQLGWPTSPITPFRAWRTVFAQVESKVKELTWAGGHRDG
jgi:hypothetical protein